MIKNILVIAVLLVACNTNKNIVGGRIFNLKAQLPRNGKLLSAEDAKRFYEKIDFPYPDFRKDISSYLIDNVLVDVRQQRILYVTSEKTGAKRLWTLKDWSNGIMNIWGGNPDFHDFRKGKTNNIEYPTYNLNYEGMKNIPLHVKDIMARQGFSTCEIHIVSTPQDSLKSKKVFNYVIKHFQINKDTLVQAH